MSRHDHDPPVRDIQETIYSVPDTTSAPPRSHRSRRRRLRIPLAAGTGMLAVAVVAVSLIVKGSMSSPPPPAPTPERTFQSAAPPSTLLPGDVVVSDRPSGSRPATSAPPASIAPGNADAPPSHVGLWTYSGANRLFIQTLGVEAPIQPVGTDNGAMVVPTDVQQVGRWDGGAELGDPAGTVLLVGHVNFADRGPGALHELYRIQAGAVIVTTDAAGRRSSWRVTGVQSVDKQALPADIFRARGPRRLVLVTCGGNLIHISGTNGGYNTYENNVIVRADPA